jgi:hypothetical protein
MASRIGLFCTFSMVASFEKARKELQDAKELGIVSADNPLYQWITNPETIDGISKLEPTSMTEDELVGLEIFGEKAELVKAALNKSLPAGKYLPQKTIAGVVASALNPNFKNLEIEEQEDAKKIPMQWVVANTKDSGDAIFVSKGRSGTTLRVSL